MGMPEYRRQSVVFFDLHADLRGMTGWHGILIKRDQWFDIRLLMVAHQAANIVPHRGGSWHPCGWG